MNSPILILPLIDQWRQLSQGARDNIIGGVIGGLAVAIIVWLLVTFRRGLASGLRRLFGGTSPPDSRHELTIKLDSSAPPQPVPPQPTPPVVPALTSRIPSIPRPPAVGFVARRDPEGRDIVELLRKDLSPENSALVVLWGEGGIGKTTLAAETAHSLIDIYGNRIMWTSAEKRADFTYATFLDEIAIRLDRPDLLRLAVEPKATEVQGALASSPALLVLDNFETISAEEAKLCLEFLSHRVTCAALITTREQIARARNIRIDAMSPEEARELLKRLISQSADPAVFANLDHERLIETAARNPLVLEWIVAQIALAQTPVEVLDDLRSGKGDAAQRVFDRSFNLHQLGDDGRAVLLALSLFVPSASREALAAVSGFGNDRDRLNDALRHLAALRLVATTENGERLFVQGLTRELAKARLEKY